MWVWRPATNFRSPKIAHFIEFASTNFSSTIRFSKGCYLLTLTGSFYFPLDFPALAWSDGFSETTYAS